MANVTLKSIKKLYEHNVEAVSDFNLEIADKEFIVLVGPSGCGKSTTLRMIAGLEEISSGELYIDGKLVNDVAPKDRDIAMVFQTYALYPHMTVYENMAFALKMRKESKQEIDAKVMRAAQILDIEPLLKRKPKQLSGGQRQRVAIGRAIVRAPKVFLMDEPLSNLDAKLRNQMRAEIIKLRQRVNTTFVYVTHDQTEAMTLGDRIVIMKSGLIQQVGTPQEVFNHPKNTFVAGFIGTPQMNFFDAQLMREGDKYSVRLSDCSFELTHDMQRELSSRGVQASAVTLGIRPEHIDLASEQGALNIPATVDVSEMLGSEIYLHVTSCGKEAVVRVVTATLPKDCGSRFSAGAPIGITFNPELCHLFDAETGENLLALQ